MVCPRFQEEAGLVITPDNRRNKEEKFSDCELLPRPILFMEMPVQKFMIFAPPAPPCLLSFPR